MLISKIKQNLAGFAAVVIAAVGFVAVAPAHATNYASNTGAVADPARSYSESRNITLDSNGQNTIVVPANNNRLAYNFQVSLSTSQSTALRGQTISFEYSMMNGSTAVTSGAIITNAYVGNTYLTPTGANAATTFAWPASATGNADSIGFYPYWNGSPALSAGTYTITFKVKANGVVLTSSNATFYSSVQLGYSGANSGTLTAGASMASVGFGTVCIDPSLVTNGDVLTARVLTNGTVENASNWTPNAYWKANQNTVGSMSATHTVATAEIPTLAIQLNSYTPSSVAAGATFTTDLSVTKANGTEVTYPCPNTVPSTPVVTSSSNTQVVATFTGSADACQLLRSVTINGQQVMQPFGFAAPSNGTCTIVPMGPPGSTFASGTYTVAITLMSYWSSMGNQSTNNPTVVISANNAQQQQQQQVQNNSAPQVPTNIPVIAPIAIPAAGIQPGGALVLDGRNLSSLKSIKIDATSTTTVATSAGVEVKVPTDLAPGAHDLLITTATGSTLFVGAIKIADPLVVAAKQAQAKAAASISFRAPIDFNIGKSVSSAQSSQVKALATQYKTGKSAICVAIPASKATIAAATAAAAKVCSTIKAAIPGIKTTVVVGDPSGDKNNRVESEIQG